MATSLCVKLRERLLNQLSSLSDTMGEGRHLHAALLPVEMKPGVATFSHGFEPPSDGEMPVRLLKCAVFDRIGHELVRDSRKGLDCA